MPATPDWIRWQEDLLHAITDDAEPAVDDAGLAVYRNNYRVALGDTLSMIYPVCRQLLGAEFFDAMAQRHIAVTPSRSGNLHCYGDTFADFVAGFGPAAPYPYLGDVCRLEWAVHRGYYSADRTARDTGDLAAIPQDDWPGCRLILMPGFAVLASPHPVVSIWRAHQPGGTPADVRPGAEHAMVYRVEGRMQVDTCLPASHAFLAGLLAGHSLASAAGLAVQLDDAFDLLGALLPLFRNGQIADIRPESQP